MQLSEDGPSTGIDPHARGAGWYQRFAIQHVPVESVFVAHVNDAALAASVLEDGVVRLLTATARMERRSCQAHGTRSAVDYLCLVFEQIGLFVAKINGHAQVLQFRQTIAHETGAALLSIAPTEVVARDAPDERGGEGQNFGEVISAREEPRQAQSGVDNQQSKNRGNEIAQARRPGLYRSVTATDAANKPGRRLTFYPVLLNTDCAAIAGVTVPTRAGAAAMCARKKPRRLHLWHGSVVIDL